MSEIPTSQFRAKLRNTAYTIKRRDDLSLQFDPPVGSRELANALSLKFPLEESLRKQMQCALLEYIASESPDREPVVSDSSVHPGSFSGSSNAPGLIRVWNVITGAPSQKKRRKRAYDNDKRRKVAEVRRSGACAIHRKRKTECNLDCPLREHCSKSNSSQVAPESVSNVVDNLLPTSSQSSQESISITNTTPATSIGSDFSGTYDFSFYDPSFQDFDGPVFQEEDDPTIWNLTTISTSSNSFDTGPVIGTSGPPNFWDTLDSAD